MGPRADAALRMQRHLSEGRDIGPDLVVCQKTRAGNRVIITPEYEARLRAEKPMGTVDVEKRRLLSTS